MNPKRLLYSIPYVSGCAGDRGRLSTDRAHGAGESTGPTALSPQHRLRIIPNNKSRI